MFWINPEKKEKKEEYTRKLEEDGDNGEISFFIVFTIISVAVKRREIPQPTISVALTIKGKMKIEKRWLIATEITAIMSICDA